VELPTLTSRRYAVAPGVRLCILDDEAIVFNPFSWETHLLNCAAALALDMASSGPCTEATIHALLAEVLDEQERPRAAEHARELVQQLLALRLLVEQPPESDASH
jgi:PqqD family protein of HPr-rel-A system